jgi:hypothetical protein
MATTYNFPDHVLGDTFQGVTFNVVVTPIAINLIGAVIVGTFTMSTNKNIVHTLSTTDSQITISDATNFVISEQVLSWPKGIYDYRIKITLATGKVKTYIEGTWEII